MVPIEISEDASVALLVSLYCSDFNHDRLTRLTISRIASVDFGFGFPFVSVEMSDNDPFYNLFGCLQGSTALLRVNYSTFYLTRHGTMRSLQAATATPNVKISSVN